MKKTLSPGPRCGCVQAPPSKSQAHRLLLCAAAGERETEIVCGEFPRDVAATIDCLNALGARIRETGAGLLSVSPIRHVPSGCCQLPCGESGATLRFMLPFAGALGAQAVLMREGRLPHRPLEPLTGELYRHGMRLKTQSDAVLCEGRLLAGEYSLPGNVSSQFVSGLLMALPLLEGESSLTVKGPVESSPYIAMTEETLRQAGISFQKDHGRYQISGFSRPHLPEQVSVEGDWSGSAVFLCIGALSPAGVMVRGLSRTSAHGDRAILEILQGFGTEIREREDVILIRRGSLRGQTIDAADIPDLIPPLCAVAAVAEGETRIVNAGRLRLKESDRLSSITNMLSALGADIEELPDGLLIRGKERLCGGIAPCAGDHRIAMAAAVAACACSEPVTVTDAECVQKSYPRFWKDWDALEGVER